MAGLRSFDRACHVTRLDGWWCVLAPVVYSSVAFSAVKLQGGSFIVCADGLMTSDGSMSCWHQGDSYPIVGCYTDHGLGQAHDLHVLSLITK
jgi:hypothetical protein